MKKAILGRISADHTQQRTMVDVALWDFVSDGIRRRLDSYQIEVPGATVDVGALRPAVKARLVAAAIITEGDDVLTEIEARG